MIKFNSDYNENTKEEILKVFETKEYILSGSYEVGMERIIQNTLSMIYIAALIVAATFLTAVLNMMIIMKSNIVVRRKEYGIWRAIGMSLEELKNSIRLEVLKLLIVSYILAVVISLPIQIYMYIQMGIFNVSKMIYGYIGVGITVITLVYVLVILGLKFKDTNEIILDIREDE